MINKAKMLGLLILLLIAAASTQAQYFQWIELTNNAAFAPRDGAGGVVFDGKMFLIGGWNPMDQTNFPLITSNDVWSSTDGQNWLLEKPNEYNQNFQSGSTTDWEGRHSAGYVVHNGKIFIVGGDANQGHYQNDVWSFCSDCDGSGWKLETNNVPWGPRVLHHTVVFQNKIWVMGGQTLPQFVPGSPIKYYRDMWTSSNGKDWTQVDNEDACHPLWESAGLIVGSVVHKGKMWVIGGGKYPYGATARAFYNHVWSSADGYHWTEHPQASPTKFNPRQYHNIEVWDGLMWVIGGYDETFTNRRDVWYSEDGAHWTELEGSPFAPRHAGTVFSRPDGLYLLGGNSFDKKVWKLVRVQ